VLATIILLLVLIVSGASLAYVVVVGLRQDKWFEKYRLTSSKFISIGNRIATLSYPADIYSKKPKIAIATINNWRNASCRLSNAILIFPWWWPFGPRLDEAYLLLSEAEADIQECDKLNEKWLASDLID